MITHSIMTFPAGDNEIQRLQVACFDNWTELSFLHPDFDPEGFRRVCSLYRDYLIPAAPYAFGQLVLFYLPDGAIVPEAENDKYGSLLGRERNAAAILREGLRIRSGRPVFKTYEAQALYEMLEGQDAVRIVRGLLPNTQVIPVGKELGFLSKTEREAKLRANLSFFLMDPFDCATVYDVLGTPFGYCVKDGEVLQPPLFGREALVVRRDGSVRIEATQLKTHGIALAGTVYVPGKNCKIYERPDCVRTPPSAKTDIIICGQQVIGVHPRGGTAVPAGGFVLRPSGAAEISVGERVCYTGAEDVLFAVQVGNSVLRDGVKTEQFISRFFNIRKPRSFPYPPSLYPMDFEKARAPRMVLGADREGKPMLAWVEGAGKFGHVPGEEGCGASLKELAELCAQAGFYNAVNLDGGGSAQILVGNGRSLRISDRDSVSFAELERAVPNGLCIR